VFQGQNLNFTETFFGESQTEGIHKNVSIIYGVNYVCIQNVKRPMNKKPLSLGVFEAILCVYICR
jgi:hypothetical protein